MLWFYTGWYLGAELAMSFGVSPLLGPIVGINGAILVAADPGGKMFRSGRRERQSTSAVHATTH